MRCGSLAVCDARGGCDASEDQGGFFVLAPHGPKGPISLRPGLVERRAVAALATGGAAPEICVRAKVHVIDYRRADEVIEGHFSAADGSGKLVRSKLFASEVPAQLIVGGATHRDPLAVTIELDLVHGNFMLVGQPIARAKDGCFTVDVLPDPLARTPVRFASAGQGNVVRTTVLASGAWPLRNPPKGWPKDRLVPFRLDVVGDQLRFASLAASIAALVADGKPHAIKMLSSGTKHQLATLSIVHAAD